MCAIVKKQDYGMPLTGIKVLDLTASQMPGRWASGMLADFGAEVIIVERVSYSGVETGPSGFKHFKSLKSINRFYAFNSFDRNKKSISLDLKFKESKDIFYKLVRKADVVIEGNRPGVAKRLGVDYETLKEINPRLVYSGITSYGQDGPYCGYPGYDLNCMAVAGALDVTGEKGCAPVMPGVQLGDWVGGGYMTVVGILLALIARDKTGRGQFLDISMTDGILACMAMFFEEYFRTGDVPKRGERANTGGAHYNNIYLTKDKKYITIAAWDPKMYANLCKALGCEDLIPYQYPLGKQKKERVFNIFQNIFRSKTRQEWLDYLRDRNIAVAPEYSLDEVFTDAQLMHRQMKMELNHPTEGTVNQIGIPIKLSDTPGYFRGFAPTPGKNTNEILLSLGYTDVYIEELRKKGAIGNYP
jgi:crotonobetainyl-CoA:carnitine CoA-transferase CaiB-like acyl-CoA transferase